VENIVTQVTVTLPDDLAQRARSAGLLSDSTIRQLLENAMRNDDEPCAAADRMAAVDQPAPKEDVGKRLRDLWARTPVDEITPEIEQEIVELVRADRAEQRRQRAL
jgi:hypothetical protein